MKFVNTNESAELNFTVMGKDYKVAADGEVDVDPKHVPYVLRRGLQLKMGSKPAKPKVEAPKPKPKAEPKAVEPKVELKPQEKPADK